jgi:hypothetical protein
LELLEKALFDSEREETERELDESTEAVSLSREMKDAAEEVVLSRMRQYECIRIRGGWGGEMGQESIGLDAHSFRSSWKHPQKQSSNHPPSLPILPQRGHDTLDRLLVERVLREVEERERVRLREVRADEAPGGGTCGEEVLALALGMG